MREQGMPRTAMDSCEEIEHCSLDHQCKILMRTPQKALGIAVERQSENWLQTELIVSTVKLLLMMTKDTKSTRWDINMKACEFLRSLMDRISSISGIAAQEMGGGCSCRKCRLLLWKHQTSVQASSPASCPCFGCGKLTSSKSPIPWEQKAGETSSASLWTTKTTPSGSALGPGAQGSAPGPVPTPALAPGLTTLAQPVQLAQPAIVPAQPKAIHGTVREVRTKCD